MSYLPKKNPNDPLFEDSAVGRMKKQLWEASDTEVDKILTKYEIPSPPEWNKEGSYIQTTIRYKVPEIRNVAHLNFTYVRQQFLLHLRPLRIRNISTRCSRAFLSLVFE